MQNLVGEFEGAFLQVCMKHLQISLIAQNLTQFPGSHFQKQTFIWVLFKETANH